MRDYIVHNTDEPVFNQWFLVKANSKKEAMNKVYKVYGDEYRKKDYEVYSLNDLYRHSEESIVVIL